MRCAAVGASTSSTPRDGEAEHRIDLHFRDSHVDDQGRETIMHEYTVTGTVDLRTGRIGTVSARANVLPWLECPGALASAQRVDGMELSELRTRIRKEFVGPQHLHPPQRQPALPGRRHGTPARPDAVGVTVPDAVGLMVGSAPVA